MAVGIGTQGGFQAQAPIKGVLWMTVAAFFFAVSVGLVRYISDTIDAFEQTFWRQFIGMLIILPFVWRSGLGGFKTRQVGTNLLRSLVGYAGISLSFYSVTLIPLAESLALQFTLPLFTIVFAMLVLTVAAAEAAVGLAILVVYFRNRGQIEVENVNVLRG